MPRVKETGLPLIYVNQVGGQDELVFDGASFGLNADCSLAFQLGSYQECVVTARWRRNGASWHCDGGPNTATLEGDRADYAACVLGLRDYVDKNGFPGVVLGLSGGIDSALCAAMAVDALGAERVRCVMMPYRFTAQESLDDAAGLRQGARRALQHAADRRRGRRLRSRAQAGLRRIGRATSPRKICRRARAAPS